MIRNVVEVAAARGVRTAVCGEMAADPMAAAVLIGLGVTELSMNPAAIPAVKQMIRSVTAGDCRAIADGSLKLGTVTEFEEFVRRRVLAMLPEEYACPL